MVNSRSKGKRGELEARDQVRLHWAGRDCVRSAQVSGKFSSDLSNALPGAHLEVKRYHSIAATRWYEQAVRDRKPGEFPIVLMREDGATKWLVMLAIEDSPRFATSLLEQLAKSTGVIT